MSKEIIINAASFETRVAVLENGTLSEVYHEREKEKGIVGNLYKGKVVKVLPGMEAAFVDIGQERAAFLYIDDIIPEKIILDENSDNPPLSGKKNRNTPIEKLLKEGENVLVQVSKDPISAKGARITSHISLPGRYLVFMPTVNTLGVSRQITDDRERQRLKEVIDRLRPQNSGCIIRTVADGRTDAELRSDLNYLVSLWDEIIQKYQKLEAPVLLYSDPNLIYRTIRDILSPEVRVIMIDDEQEHKEIKHFLKQNLPRYHSYLRRFQNAAPIFDYYGIEDEIHRALGQKIWMKSGGFLVIEQTEALTSVDVNTGRFVGKESHEKTILKTNLEAAKEVVSQLQLRNIGGIIIIDFIDMEVASHRQMVYQALKEELRNDKTRSKILQISEMGLVEMTRKRDSESLSRYLCTTCPYCEGRGSLKSASTITFDIFREIYRECTKNKRGSIVVYVHPDVHEYMQEQEKSVLLEIEEELAQTVTIKPVSTFHPEQFELYQY